MINLVIDNYAKEKISILSFIAVFLFCTSCESNENDKLEDRESVTMSDKLINKEEQSFKVASTIEPIEIKGSEGTVLRIPANSLVNEETGDLYDGECTLKLQEFYSLSDMLLGNLNTQTSDDKLLSSGGMVYIEVLDSNSQCLTMREETSYQLQFPKQEKTSQLDMRLFYGDLNKTEQIEWIESESNLLLTDQVWGLNDSIVGSNNMYEGTVDNFIFYGAKFGWINCDAFVNFDNEKLLSKIIVNDPSNSFHRIIDKKSMSIGVLYQERKKGSYEFTKLQKGGRYWLLSMNKDGSNYYYDLREVKLTEKVNQVNPEYSKVDLKTLRKKLESLN